MPVKLKTGALLATAVTGVIFGVNHFNSEGDAVVSQTLTEERETPLSGPHPEIQDGTGPLPVKSESTWEPSLVDYSGTGTWDWGVGYTEKDKEKNRADAKRVLDTLEDYTFKFFLPCTVGTGWILDYQIPDKEGDYPTKWYIATNSHVIWRLKFSNKNNDYGQTLMYSNTDYLRRTNGQGNAEDYKGKVRDKCENIEKTGYFDMNISSEKTWKKGRKAELGAISQNQMKEPKLFYSAFNFIDPNVARSKGIPPNNHFADFSVIEIEFTSQDEAREATNGFADKYKVGSAEQPIKFGRSIEKRYGTKKALWEAKDNYYILAFPVLKGKAAWEHTHNFDHKTTFASHLIGNGWDYDKAGSPDKYRGFVSARKYSISGTVHAPEFKWNGQVYHEFGHFYALEHNRLDGGASGGMYVDSDGHAVGIIAQVGGNMTWVQPFRSEGVKGDEFDTPGYDLILGGFEGQKSSYRDQVQKYIIEKGKETWLSKSGRLKLPAN